MTDNEPRRGAELDDWFDEPETDDVWSSRVDRLVRERQAPERALPADDWLQERPRPTARRSNRLPIPQRGVIATAVLLIVLLLAVLAAAGVFSGSSRPRSVGTTTPTTPAATTTAATVTQPQPLPVPTTALKPGDHGTAVSQLQRALARAGDSPGKADGVYGSGTTAAVKKFQSAHGLTADGFAGPQTLAALKRAVQTP
jgi:peptidoglycan hydrolase-like protein with peptidoglycan-binding domain